MSDKSNNSDNVPKINDYDYIPLVVKLADNDDHTIFKAHPNPQFSVNIDYPLCVNGFTHFYHASKNKLEILDQFVDKKKVYLVLNKFETKVDNYDQSIEIVADKYLSSHPIDTSFYELWELLYMFDLVDDKKPITTVTLDPASLQTIEEFRNKYSPTLKNDKYYHVTMHSDIQDLDKHLFNPDIKPNATKNILDDRRVIQHKTYPTAIIGGYDNRDDGDIRKHKTIKLVGGELKGLGLADLVIMNGTYGWHNLNTIEQRSYNILFSQIILALNTQQKGGNFICKFSETNADITMKLVYLLSKMYKETYFVKPLVSRFLEADKYLVCIGFKYTDKDNEYRNVMKSLNEVHKELQKNGDLNLVELWKNITFDQNFQTHMIHVNKTLANKQFKNINDSIAFINAQNYYGDVYQKHRSEQIAASKYWIELFFPDKKESDRMIKHVRESTIKASDKIDKILENVKYV